MTGQGTDVQSGGRRAAAPVGFVVVLVAGLVGLVGPAGARPGAGGPRSVEIGKDHARVSVIASNGSALRETPMAPTAIPVEVEASDFSAFSEAVDTIDDSDADRGAAAHATQDTTVDDSEDVLKVESTGSAGASGFDDDPGTGAGPSADATSEFSITFEVTEFSSLFTLTGEISATTADSGGGCTTVTVTSPTGAVFEVAAPSACGRPGGQSIAEGGSLEPGTYTLSVVADAPVSNPNAAGGTAGASFEIDLGVGCGINGTSGDDTLTGTAEGEIICGLGGNDTLDGLDGDDLIIGGSGVDSIHGGPGDDIILGNEQNDVLFGDADNDRIHGDEGTDTIEGGTGNDVVFGGDEKDIIAGDELLSGAGDCLIASSPPGSNDDEIFGGGGNDFLEGCQGLDKIHGEGGDDQVHGESGNDVLLGNAGSDKIHGDSGSDKLTGGTRKDVLFGDGGNDTLIANDGVLDVVHGGPGNNDNARLDVVDVVDGVEIALVG